MNVLVICDDYWHPANTPKAGLEPLAGAEFTFDILEDATEWSSDRMDEYPVVLFTKSNNVTAEDKSPWMSEDVQRAFVDYVRKGNGLLVVHSGTAGYKDLPVIRGLIGGVFIHHPEQCPVTVNPKEGHPLTAGSTQFTLQDEHYHMELDDADAELFLTAESQHGTQPAGWTRKEGDGRVCVLTPGHNVEVWHHPSYQTLLKNALRWCSDSQNHIDR